MVRVIIDDVFSVFRETDFISEVIEIGIKEYGDDGTPKAFINFADGGAPLTFFIKSKDGKSLIEYTTEGHARIKKQGVGVLIDQLKTFGYQPVFDEDPESYEFDTIPSLIGLTTSWKADKGKESIDSEGNMKKGFTNFNLVAVSGKAAPAKTQAPIKQGDAKPIAGTQPAAKPGEVIPEILTAWKEALTTILIEPMDAGSIQREINELSKALPAGDPQRAMYGNMSKVRPAALKTLTDQGFLTKDADLKFNLA